MSHFVKSWPFFSKQDVLLDNRNLDLILVRDLRNLRAQGTTTCLAREKVEDVERLQLAGGFLLLLLHVVAKSTPHSTGVGVRGRNGQISFRRQASLLAAGTGVHRHSFLVARAANVRERAVLVGALLGLVVELGANLLAVRRSPRAS